MSYLDVEGLSITFGGLKAVQNFNLHINKKELYGLIGPNGAGKTTIFNLLTGVYKPDEGSIILDGKELVGLKTHEINHCGIARTFQNIRLFDKLTVLDNVMAGFNTQQYICSFFDSVFHTPRYFKCEKEMKQKAMDILKVFELDEYASYKASQLPYGQQRKLEIARAVATNPRLLLLDEPAAGMNPQETQELMETIRLIRDEFNLTILLIEHDMRLVSGICERLTVLNFGQVLTEGETKKVLNDPVVIKAYLGD